MENLVTLLSEPSAWMALFTLIVMEVVLGIDNLIFVSILTNKLPEAQRPKARVIGLSLALIFRLALLGTVAIIVQLVEPVITLLDHSFSWRDIILITGGLFLVWKATKEIHHSVDPGDDDADAKNVVVSSFATVIGQILVLDLVFSIDSIITAVGMTDHISIMVIAVVTAVIAMLLAAGPLSRFIEANPTIVILALGFLLMIGMTLIADGFGVHVPKGYIYAAMAFSAFVELLNMLSRKRRKKKASQA
ncbi:TerC family protein [Kiloniella majae]|uniref:TerC family protein n=1 Tax=Kiloniella majae TaxID=1938558 RepID=UPI000A27943C|nr:TerC family protein [Kiloniella majae]